MVTESALGAKAFLTIESSPMIGFSREMVAEASLGVKAFLRIEFSLLGDLFPFPPDAPGFPEGFVPIMQGTGVPMTGLPFDQYQYPYPGAPGFIGPLSMPAPGTAYPPAQTGFIPPPPPVATVIQPPQPPSSESSGSASRSSRSGSRTERSHRCEVPHASRESDQATAATPAQ